MAEVRADEISRTEEYELRGKEIVNSLKGKVDKLMHNISAFGKKAKEFITSNSYVVIGATGAGVEKAEEGAKVAARKIKAVPGKVANAVKVTAQEAKKIAANIKDNGVAALNNTEAVFVNTAYKGYNKLVNASASIHADLEVIKAQAHNAMLSLDNAGIALVGKIDQGVIKVKAGAKKAIFKVREGTKLSVLKLVTKADVAVRNVVQKGITSILGYAGVQIEQTADWSKDGAARAGKMAKVERAQEKYNTGIANLNAQREESLEDSRNRVDAEISRNKSEKYTPEQINEMAEAQYNMIVADYAIKEEKFKEKMEYRSIFADRAVAKEREVEPLF